MKWRPQDVVAAMLAAVILLFVIGSVIVLLLGTDKSESPDLWADLMKVVTGGLIGYIMGGDKKK